MRVIGVKCGKEQLQWAVVEGTCRADAVVLDYAETPAPPGDRAEQLEWCRKEVTELLTRHRFESAAIRVAEAGQNVSAALGRAEMDGVVQAALAAASVPVRRYYSASVKSAFKAKTRQAADAAAAAIPCVAASPCHRRGAAGTDARSGGRPGPGVDFKVSAARGSGAHPGGHGRIPW